MGLCASKDFLIISYESVVPAATFRFTTLAALHTTSISGNLQSFATYRTCPLIAETQRGGEDMPLLPCSVILFELQTPNNESVAIRELGKGISQEGSGAGVGINYRTGC